MRYAKLMENDTVDIDSGICVSVWLQGCHFHCKGCHNPDTWDFNGGIEIDDDELISMISKAITAYNIKRDLSILGGEPLCRENIKFVAKLIEYIKCNHPSIRIFCWTGYEFDYLQKQNDTITQYILNNVDVMVTGPFILEQRDITLKLRGSHNQQVWTRINGKLVLDQSI